VNSTLIFSSFHDVCCTTVIPESGAQKWFSHVVRCFLANCDQDDELLLFLLLTDNALDTW